VIGTSLGSYQIVAKLGEGGMGEVYRARDSKLDRDVALKILPESFASDPDRLMRFEREAKTLASLNHPNIAAIYGLEGDAPQAGGGEGRPLTLVMELVEGEDLSARISRGPMPIDEVLTIARQIADALEAAHEQGIVHRDLKPANVKVRPDGTVKVLDFGLAKAMDPAAGASGADAMNSPTLTARATQMGMILGTAAYMSPEQARGRATDRRADIWAFGVVVYEMLTGRRAFEGEDISITLASVLKEDVDWDALPADLPASLRRLLRRCLEKDPRKRLSAIGDARLELDEQEPAGVARPATAPPAKRPSLVARLWPALAGAAVTAVVAFLWLGAQSAATGNLTRLSILPPPGAELYPDSTGVAISPDGTMVAFVVGNVAQSDTQLWVRSLDSMSARQLEGASGATLPFWSPDSRRIGFFASTGTGDQLKTISVAGGRAEVVCDAPAGRGATWGPSNVIVFAPDAGGPLYRVSASGGTPEPVTTLDPARNEYGHRFPSFLPDGDHFLFAAIPGKDGLFSIFAGSLSDSSRTPVASMESAPVYAEPGWLLYTRQGVLAARRFDARTLEVMGDPVPLEDEPTSILDPATSFTAGYATSVSRTGSLAYFSSPSVNTVATWYDVSGRVEGTLDLPPGHYETATISPDGARAVFVRSTSPSESALWLVDLTRGSTSLLTSGHGRNDTPVWSPDGTRVVFTSDRDGPQQLYVKSVDDGSPEELLASTDAIFKAPTDWSPDGRWIVITQLDPDTAQNVWLLPADGGGEPTLFFRGPTRDNSGPISPDGRWLAYVSEETGQFELYVQSFPTPGRRVQVSQQGAVGAWWTRDGRQLLFLGLDKRSLWRVEVSLGTTVGVGTPRQIATFPPSIVSTDAMPDRQRFLTIAPERTGIGSATVVQNWLASLDSGR
jgi:Tol biopolymer transport system component